MTNFDQIKVTKRDGKLEPIDLDKIHKVITWAAENLDNVSVSQVELKSHIQFYDGIELTIFTKPLSKPRLTLYQKTLLTTNT